MLTMPSADPNQAPEQAIATYCRSRDPHAFKLLVEQYQHLVYAAARRKLARPEDAEDVTQQTFLALARSACRVKTDLANWLYTTALNAATDLIRQDAARRRREFEVATTPPTQNADHLALLKAVDDALLTLPESQRSLLTEHFLANRSQRDLAASLGLSQPTLSRRITEAVTALREKLAIMGCAAPLPLLSSQLTTLTPPAPTHLTTTLTKIALAGPAPTAAATTTVPLTLKFAALTLSTLLLATATYLFFRPAAPVPTAAKPPAAPTTLPAPKTKDEALTRLLAKYTLAPDENLRLIPAPFPQERTDWVNLEMPHARGADNVQSFGLTLSPNRPAQYHYMSYRPADTRTLVESVLLLPWHTVPDRHLIPWQPLRCDAVLRDNLTVEQKLNALAQVIQRTTGQSIHFEPYTDRRPTLVLTGIPRPGFVRKPNLPLPASTVDVSPTLIFTVAPMTPEQVKAQILAGIPKGGVHGFTVEQGAQRIDTPYLQELPDRDRTLNPQPNSYCIVMPDAAKLTRADPLYRQKLTAIAQNLQAQVGAKWTVEDRDFPAYRPVTQNP